MFKPITLEIPTIAVAKSRVKRGKYGHAYIPQKTKSFEAELRWHWQKSKQAMLPVEPTALIINCYLPRPKKPKHKLYPIARPDLDNFAKSIMDSLNGFAWKDDAQITSLTITKRYGGTPRVIIAAYAEAKPEDVHP